MSKKQITLFQTWNKTLSQDPQQNLSVADKNTSTPVRQLQSLNEASTSTSSPNLFKVPGYSKSTDELVNPEFDYEAAKTWIYPTNYPVRDYQFSIVKEALFKNTLVVLPTGLGKTFIAAVVMYNIYRWFPNGKVIFMAPTKPLVAQQVDACFNITGIPYEDTTQMTGTNSPILRKRMWQKKRVFFLTPQVLVNDLVRNICPASSIKCVVVDEAHKALGNHAYCQVIKELCTYTTHFRVLALTATPGSDTVAVKQVLTNLLISHVEMRHEDSADVQQYSHIRDIEKIVVPLGDRLNALKTKFLDVINLYLKRLVLRKVMSANKNPAKLSKFQVLKLREAFSQNPPSNIDRATYGLAMADFSLLISLYHAYELLLLHGAKTFYNFLLGILNGDKSIPHARSELLKNFEFQDLIENVKNTYIPEVLDANAALNGQINKKKRVLPGHPKLDKLLEVVLEHFRLANFENLIDTRVMIFTQYRDSVLEIVDLLNQHQPTIKVMSFVGQASKSVSNVGFSQKQQLQVLQKFRSGGYNTLVSTCVGEEGLDIGEVDLIVCYDCPKSPIRSVQRMGRTGRLRKGRIVLLIAEGKEEQMYHSCEYRKKSVHNAISRGFSFAQFYQESTSLLPPNVTPKCVKTPITIKAKEPESTAKVVSKSAFLSDEEMEEFNQHVKIPMSGAPLLPKREFLVLKNQTVLSSSSVTPVEPQLSYHKWTLWQTTPQRTDLIPHSSKSLLLVRTLEHIHFPEIVTSKFLPSQISDFTHSKILNTSANHSKNKKQAKSSSRRQSKITDCIPQSVKNSSFKKIINDEKLLSDDVVEICLSPAKDVDELIIPVSETDGNLKRICFIEQIFKFDIPNPLGEINVEDIKAPPVIEKLLNIENFCDVNVNDFSENKNKCSLILHSLNNKLKARLKRKKLELRENIVHEDIKLPTFSKKISDHPNNVNIIEKNQSSFEIPIDNIDESNNSEQKNDQENLKSVMFDIDFDIPDTFGNDMHFEEDLLLNVDNNNKNNSQHCKNKQDPVNLDDSFHKTVDEVNVKYSVGSNLKQSTFKELTDENYAFSNDSKCFHVTKEPVKDSEFTNNSVIPLEGISQENEKLSGQYELVSYTKESSNVKNGNQCNSTKLPNNIITENEIPNCISFDMNFFDDDNVLQDIDNDIPEKVSYSLPNEASKTFKTVVNIPDNNHSNNGETFAISNQQQARDENKNTLTINKENQSSVLKDLKNIHNLSELEKGTELRSNTHFKNFLSEKNNNKMKSLQTLHNSEKIDSENFTECKYSFSKSENNNKMIDSYVSSKYPKPIAKNLKNINKGNVIEENEHQCDNTSENISSQTLLYNISNVLNSSLNKSNDIKLLTDQDNHEHVNTTKEKNASSCFENSSAVLSGAQISFLPDLNVKRQNVENTDECSFNFDVSFENDINNSSPAKLKFSSDSTKICSSKNINLDDFGKGTSSILEQLCSSQKNVPSDLNSSFSSLTVKRCISEAGLKENSKNRKKLCRAFNHTHNHIIDSQVMSGTKDLKDSCIFKMPNVKNNLNASDCYSNSKSNLNSFNKSTKMTDEASQYSLTQLLSLINSSENIGKSYIEKILTESPKNLKNTSENSDMSSDDEVCPTPPKKIIKPNTEFIYNKVSSIGRSLDFTNFQLPGKDVTSERHSTVSQNESNTNNINLNNFEIPERSQKNASFDIKVSKSKVENEKIECPTSSKITFDVSFDLPFTQNDFNLSGKDDMFDMNNAILIGDSSSEEKLLLSQNDSVFEHISNESKKTDLLTKNPLDNISNKDYIGDVPTDDKTSDEVTFEDSESLLPSRLNKNCDLEVLNHTTSEKCSIKNVQQNSNEKSNGLVNLNDNFPRNSDEDFDDFENSIFCKLLSSENNSVTNEQLLNVGSDLKIETVENASNSKSNDSFCVNDKNIPETKKNNANLHTLNSVCNEACSAKFTKNSHENDSSLLKMHNIEKDFNDAKSLLKEKNFSELTNKSQPNVTEFNKDMKQYDNEFYEENLCFDLALEDETCFLLPFKNESDSNENNFIKNSLIVNNYSSPKSSSDFETKREFKNVFKKSIFKKTETRIDILDKGKDVELTEVNDAKIEFDLNEDLSILSNVQKKNISLHNHDEKKSFNAVNNNDSSDEFDDQNQNQSKKTKTGCKLTKIFEPSTSKQETNFSKSKPTFKSNSNKKNYPKMVLKDNSICDVEEEDFQFIKKIQKKTNNSSVSKKTKRKGLSKRNEFLLSQAEVSGSDNSGHESDYEEEDALEGSFIDDGSPHKMDYTDQHAFYLKSLNDFVGLPQKFKLKPLQDHSIITQGEENCSNYELDSFCVNDDDILLLSSDDNVQYDQYNSPDELDLNKKNTKRKLKRVVTHDSSTSSEHETSPKFRKYTKDSTHTNSKEINASNKSLISIRKSKIRRVLESSDEEDDHSFIKPLVPDRNNKNGEVSSHLNDDDPVSEKVLDSIDANAKVLFTIDFDDDIEFISEMSPSVDEAFCQKSKTDYKNDLNNSETNPSIQKSSICRQSHSNLDVKNTGLSSTDKVEDVSFDISWDIETCPSTSNNVKTSILNGTVASLPTENVSCNSVVEEKINAPSVILVDSRELASGKPVVSSLRNKYKINPIVIQLTAADYVISNRIAVERIFDSEFSSHSMPPKIIQKVKEMIDIYVKSVVIIEKDTRKNILSFNKNITKYLQFIVQLNYVSHVQVLFSKSIDHTAELIANLVQQEKSRGFHINVPVTLDSKNQKLFDFYCTFPKMTHTCALNFMYYFPTVELLLKSSVEDLKKKGCISSQKAASFYKYFRSQITFNEKL